MRICKNIFLLAGLFILGCRQTIPRADLLLIHGRIFTVDPEKPFAQAVAIQGDRIMAVGTDEELAFYRGDQTRVIDLGGKFACPGFNDSHVRLLKGGYSYWGIDLRGVTNIRDIQRLIIQVARNLQAGSWIVGKGWDEGLFPENEYPSRRQLDSIAPHIPIYLERSCGHAAWVNSLALRIAQIDDNTPNPPNGEIVQDEQGRPTGILKDSGMLLVSQYIEDASPETKKQALENVLDEIRRLGITSIQDHASSDALPLIDQIRAENRLTCRISYGLSLRTDPREIQRIRQLYAGSNLRFGFLTCELDGGLAVQTASLMQPYENRPDSRGILKVSQEELDRLVIRADQDVHQVALHATGDRPARMILRSYELAEAFNGNQNRRHRIENASLFLQEDFRRLSELNVVLSMQPILFMADLKRAEMMLGLQRTLFFNAWRSLKNTGAVLAFGSGWPEGSLNPMLGIYAAVTRKDTTGYPEAGWYPGECLTIQEAVEAYTLGSAYAEGLEQEKGTLMPGMLADIVVLDRDILNGSPEILLQVRVVYTIVGGNVVFSLAGAEEK